MSGSRFRQHWRHRVVRRQRQPRCAVLAVLALLVLLQHRECREDIGQVFAREPIEVRVQTIQLAA
jgi:hypothetical protein